MKSADSFLWPLLSGVFISTSYIPFPPYAVFFCYVPLWVFALQQEKLKPLFIGGWLCQFVLTLIGFSYMLNTLREMEFPLYQAVFLFLLFCSFCNWHIPLSLVLWFFVRKVILSSSKATKKLVVRSDWGWSALGVRLSLPISLGISTEYVPMIFDWHLAYVYFYVGWPLAQTAEIWGFQFLNTLTLFANFIFLVLLLRLFKYNKPPLRAKLAKKLLIPLGGWLVGMLLLNGYGVYLKNRLPDPDQKIQVLMIQPHIENHQQDNKKAKPLVLSKILDETSKHLGQAQKPDFILWPEGAYPYPITLQSAETGHDPIQQHISGFHVPLVVSAKGFVLDPYKEATLETGPYTNSVFLFDKQGQLTQPPYDKRFLTPLGEYTPGVKWFPFIDKWLFGEDSTIFKKGDGKYKTAFLSSYRLGFQVCYEGLFDHVTRDLVRDGADLIISVSNDSYFGKWQEPYQLSYMTLARAIEVRRPLIRGANSGPSAIVSAKGDLLTFKEFGVQSEVEEVPLYSKANQAEAFFMSYGYYINQVFLWIGMLVVILIGLVPVTVHSLTHRMLRQEAMAETAPQQQGSQ